MTAPALMPPREVADAFHVNPKTVTRWPERGFLPHLRTPGGHRRYRRAAVEALLAELDTPADAHCGHQVISGYACTREAGHPGEHQANIGATSVLSWAAEVAS